ncbi:DUF2958 domain-containing protein [Rhizobium laguerreae]|nr:DUF2958 domain-containing protein [Rhizobium laguerreae]
MKLLTEELKAKLIANNVEAPEEDHIPVVKWFTPWANATWLIREMEPDGRCFGLCDVGQGTSELGYVSVEEFKSDYTYAARVARRVVDFRWSVRSFSRHFHDMKNPSRSNQAGRVRGK